MSMNLRADDTFVEDAGWQAAADRYEEFMRVHSGKRIVFLELGVGYNTPGIIKYMFWQYANKWRNAFYVCINKDEAYLPKEIREKSIGVAADIGEVLEALNGAIHE